MEYNKLLGKGRLFCFTKSVILGLSEKIWHLLAFVILMLFVSSTVPANLSDDNFEFSRVEWKATISPLLCKMSQKISKDTKIEFINQAGEEESLFIKFGRDYMITGESGGKVELSFISPKWKTSSKEYQSWEFELSKNDNPVIFSGEYVQKSLRALGDGLVPIITISKKGNQARKREIELDTAFFDDAYFDYLECRRNLVKANLKQIQDFNIYFDSGSSRLDKKSEEWLSYILAYVDTVTDYKIQLAGYTDNVGSIELNEKISLARTNRVKSHLKMLGVSSKNIVLVPAKDNSKTNADKALNRRVNVKLKIDLPKSKKT